jgi:predicted nucleic acid-binding protein
MILVDSSVWIGYFNGSLTPPTRKLDWLLKRQRLTLQQLASATAASLAEWKSSVAELDRIAVGDLILTEVLQGFREDGDFAAARTILSSFDVVELGGRKIAIQAAKNFRALRKAGITVRKTIDTLIATRCIESGYELLHDDRDFDPFVKYLGLRAVV